jgi:HAD superfamily hydrolase (TIGR01549 family)
VSRPPVEAVTFDFWNTLVVAHLQGTREQRRAAILEVLGEHGHVDITAEMLDGVFEDTVRAFNESWAANRQFTALDGAEHVVATLGRDFTPLARDALIAAFLDAGAQVEVTLAPNVAEVLATLDEAGLRIGIICDVGMTPSTVLRAYLARYDVLRHFDHWSFSDEVGVYKPDPAIFRHALGGLGGVDPARAAHIGDLRRTDVAGARAMGMLAVRYRGVEDDPPRPELGEPVEGDHVIDDHTQLAALLLG